MGNLLTTHPEAKWGPLLFSLGNGTPFRPSMGPCPSSSSHALSPTGFTLPRQGALSGPVWGTFFKPPVWELEQEKGFFFFFF